MTLEKNIFILQIAEGRFQGGKIVKVVLIEKWHLFVDIHENFILHEHKNEVYK